MANVLLSRHDNIMMASTKSYTIDMKNGQACCNNNNGYVQDFFLVNFA